MSIFCIRYPISKLLQIYAVREFARLLPVSQTGVVINVTNPGFCSTELHRDPPLSMRIFLAVMRFLLARSADMGSRSLNYAVVAGKESHNGFVSECTIKEYVETSSTVRMQLTCFKPLGTDVDNGQGRCSDATKHLGAIEENIGSG
jgi:hypothetical protein